MGNSIIQEANPTLIAKGIEGTVKNVEFKNALPKSRTKGSKSMIRQDEFENKIYRKVLGHYKIRSRKGPTSKSRALSAAQCPALNHRRSLYKNEKDINRMDVEETIPDELQDEEFNASLAKKLHSCGCNAPTIYQYQGMRLLEVQGDGCKVEQALYPDGNKELNFLLQKAKITQNELLNFAKAEVNVCFGPNSLFSTGLEEKMSFKLNINEYSFYIIS